jgi:hypothetical protein
MKISESFKRAAITAVTGAVVSTVVDRVSNKVIVAVTKKVSSMIDDYRNNRDNRIKVKQ